MGIFDFLKKNKNIQDNNGLNETYYNNGRGALRESFHKKDGILDGKYIEYGMITTLFGKIVEYGPTGELKQIGMYKDGKKEGTWLYNDRAGQSKYKLVGCRRYLVNYKNGKLNGDFKVYQLYSNFDSIEVSKGLKPTLSEHIHTINGEELTIGDYNHEVLVEEGKCLDGVKDGEWKIYEQEMKNIGSILENFIPAGNVLKTYSTIWEKGNQISSNAQKAKQKEFNHPCKHSNVPIIYIDTIKDDNDTNVIDCDGKNISSSNKKTLKWDLITSFINRV